MRRYLRSVIWLLLASLSASGAQASETESHAPPRNTELPAYDYPIQDGLYATITALSTLEAEECENIEKLKLKDVPGFAKEFDVSVVWQDRPAPLVIVLLGISARKGSEWSKYLQRHLYDAGFHVLVFDSVLLPSFHDSSQHGVAGNLEAEARVAAHVLDACLRHQDAQAKVTRVGIVGASYGASLSIVLAKLAHEGNVAIVPDRVLALSPPVRMESTAALLDRYWQEDRWKYTLTELERELEDHKPVPPGHPIPFDASKMRAGLAATFRLALKEVVDHNDRLYELNILPKAGLYDDQYRRDWAETWSFTRFIESMAYPYWTTHGRVTSVDELWDQGDLVKILPGCPDGVEVVLAADDPLNEADELSELRRRVASSTLKVLPHGGHLGYLSTAWCRARLGNLFPQNLAATPRVPRPAPR